MANTVRIQLRSDSTSNWEAVNPVLLRGEIGLDLTENRMKIGDGASAWKALPYAGPEVTDSLASTSATSALSANQGRVLKGLVDGKAASSTVTTLQNQVSGIKAVTVVDSLTSTSTASALSANQGRVLNGRIPPVVDNLTSTSKTDALSANQGMVLKGLIDEKASNNAVSILDGMLRNQIKNIKTVTVTDSLTSTSTTSALSANQGRVLKGLVDGKAASSTVTTLQNQVSGIKAVTVVDSLTSTSTASALSANQGRYLNSIKLNGSAVKSESWTFTLSSGGTVTKKVVLWSS